MKRLSMIFAMLSLPAAALASEFKVEVPAFADGTLKPAQYASAMGCTGGNVSPDIRGPARPRAPRALSSRSTTRMRRPGPGSGTGW